MTRVKICGNTNPEDANLAVELGADYLGIIFAESKRKVDAETALTIMLGVPEFTKFVGVFYNQPKEEVDDIIEKTGIRMLQFHGDETVRYCQYFLDKGCEVIKTFRVKDEFSLKRLDDYNATAFLFDTFSRGEKGGTGLPFDWNLIQDKPYVHEKLFLAGGLNIENVQEAIQRIRPFAVDVASGVEKAPGIKDAELLERFIYLAKRGEGEDVRKGLVHQ